MKAALTALTPAHFFHPHNKKIFLAMQEAVRESSGQDVSWVDVRDKIHPDSVARDVVRDIATRSGSVPVNERRITRFLQSLDRAYRSRSIYENVRGVITKALANDADNAYADLMDLVFSLSREQYKEGAKYIREFLPEVLEEVEKRRMSQGGVVGLRTNVKAVDTVWKGVQPENFYLIGGRPGMGKSVVVDQIAYEVGKQMNPVLLHTPEMAPKQIITRIACTIAGLDYERYNGGNYSEAEARLVAERVQELEGLPIIIDGSSHPTTTDIRQNLIRFQPKLLVVDYLQQVQPPTRTHREYADVTQVSQEINAMKKDFKIPVIAAVQLSRRAEDRDDNRPIMSDLRATGQLEQDADGIFFLYRPVEYAQFDDNGEPYVVVTEGRNQRRDYIDPELMEFICAKNRHGRKQNIKSYLRDGEMMVSQAPGDEW